MKKIMNISLWLLIAGFCLIGMQNAKKGPCGSGDPDWGDGDYDDNPQNRAADGVDFEIYYMADEDYSGPVVVLPRSSIAGAEDLLQDASDLVSLYESGLLDESEVYSALEDLLINAEIDEAVKQEALSALPGLVQGLIVGVPGASDRLYDLYQYGLEAAGGESEPQRALAY